MDSIYEASEVTIIAAAGEDSNAGIPGISLTRSHQPAIDLGEVVLLSSMRNPQRSIKSSKWYTRGWTLQESILARRRLVFTEEQVYFECNASYSQETMPLNLSLLKTLGDIRDMQTPGLFNSGWPKNTSSTGLSVMESLYSHFCRLLDLRGEFSTRFLTKDGDSLFAFTGVMNYFARVNPNWSEYLSFPASVADIMGVPFIPLNTTLDGNLNLISRTEHFVEMLGWYHDPPSSPTSLPRRRTFISSDVQIPSWSWAAWYGSILSVKFQIRRDMTIYTAFTMCECAGSRLLEPLDAFREFARSYYTHHPRVLRLCARFLKVKAVEVDDFWKPIKITVQSSRYRLPGDLYLSKTIGKHEFEALVIDNVCELLVLYVSRNWELVVILVEEKEPGGIYERVGLAKLYYGHLVRYKGELLDSLFPECTIERTIRLA
jgi:hypothetical protein